MTYVYVASHFSVTTGKIIYKKSWRNFSNEL